MAVPLNQAEHIYMSYASFYIHFPVVQWDILMSLGSFSSPLEFKMKSLTNLLSLG